MDTLAGGAMPPLRLDPTGRSFALLDQAERERLGKLLRPLAWIDGLITAAVIAPVAPNEADDEADWLDYVWNEASREEIRELTPLQTVEFCSPLVDHYAYVANALFTEPEAYRPYLAGFSDPLEAAACWAEGFRVGTCLSLDAWKPLLNDKDVLLMLIAILGLVREEDIPEDLRDDSPFCHVPPDQREHIRRETVEMLPRIVRSLFYHTLDLDEDDDDPHEPHVRASPKVGRNDPCPCGSGRKYKKCCL